MAPLPMLDCARPNSVELVVIVRLPGTVDPVRVAVNSAPLPMVVLTVLLTVVHASALPLPAPEKLPLPVSVRALLAESAPTSRVPARRTADSPTVVVTLGLE